MCLLGRHMAQEQSLSCDTHKAASSGLKGVVRGETGLIMVSIEETLSVSRVKDQVIAEEKQRQ